jgi:hypothetical protein
VGFIYNCFVIWYFRRFVAFPVEVGIDYYGAGGEGRAVGVAEAKVFFRMSHSIAKKGVVPDDRTGYGFCIGIDQQFVAIVSQAVKGVVGAMSAVSVKLSGFKCGYISMPYMVRHFGHLYTFFLNFAFERVEQAKFHSSSVFGENGEVHPFTVPRGPKRVGLAGVNLISHL